MPKRPLPPKPAWYRYAYEAQKQLDAVKPSRSGSNEERVYYQSTYQTACRDMGYEGTEADWHELRRRVRNPQPSRRPYPD